MKRILLLLAFLFPVFSYSGSTDLYFYSPPIYNLANSIYSGTLPVARGGTGTTTSTGSGSNVLSVSPTLTGTPALGSPTATGKISVTATETFRSIGDSTFMSWYKTDTTTRYGFIQFATNNMTIDNESNGSIIFYTNAIERGRIDPSGLYLFGYSADQGGGEMIQSNGGAYINGTARILGAAKIGTATLTVPVGGLGLSKITADGVAAGAGGCKFQAVCGTAAGSAKIVVSCGTSATTVTVVDNVGAGVTGC